MIKRHPTVERELKPKEKRALDEFLQAFLRLEDRKTAWAALRDICTLTELRAIAERWLVAKALKTGRPYRVISEQLGVSTTTITRVAHWMKYGRGGYRKLLG